MTLYIAIGSAGHGKGVAKIKQPKSTVYGELATKTDIELYKRWVSKKGEGHRYYGGYEVDGHCGSCRQAMAVLKKFLDFCYFGDAQPVIYYTGHGDRDGDWVFPDGAISFADIVALHRQSSMQSSMQSQMMRLASRPSSATGADLLARSLLSADDPFRLGPFSLGGHPGSRRGGRGFPLPFDLLGSRMEQLFQDQPKCPMVLSDCCYSGVWAFLAQRRDSPLNVIAASGAEQTASDLVFSRAIFGEGTAAQRQELREHGACRSCFGLYPEPFPACDD